MSDKSELWNNDRMQNEAMAAHLRIIPRFKKSDNTQTISKNEFIKDLQSQVNIGRS